MVQIWCDRLNLLAVVAPCVAIRAGGGDVGAKVGTSRISAEQVGETMLTLAILLVPVDIELSLQVGARLEARQDTLPIVAVAPPVVRVAWKDGAVTVHCVEADTDLKLELSRACSEIWRYCRTRGWVGRDGSRCRDRWDRACR